MTPLSPTSQAFQYCPHCGSAQLGTRGTKALLCADCGFEYYLNPAAAVAALISDSDGRLLIAVRGKEPAKGTWDLPGGFVDPGESAEDALRREIKEELNLDIIAMEYFCSVPNVYEYKNVAYATVDLAYICHVEDPATATPADDVDSILFKRPADIDPQKFGLRSVRTIVSRHIDSLSA